MNKQEYSPDWNDVIRPSILKRDGYKCSDCGIRHKSRVYKASRGNYIVVDSFTERWAKNQGFKVFTLYLQVCHLDQNKSNNEPENLLSKCPRCHSRYDAPFKALKRKAILSSTPKIIGSTHKENHQPTKQEIAALRTLIRSAIGVNIEVRTALDIINLIQNF